MKNYSWEGGKEWEGGEGWGGREGSGGREGCPLLTEMPSFLELLLTRTGQGQGRGQCAVRSKRNGGLHCTVHGF